MLSVERFTSALEDFGESLEFALDGKIGERELKILMKNAKKIRPDLYRAATFRDRKKVKEKLSDIESLVETTCRSSSSEDLCLKAGHDSLTRLHAASDLIPDGGSLFP